jgi:outer membrane protein assembly factor BamB
LIAVLAVLVITIAPSLLLVQPVSAQVVDAPWPMFQHDPAHAGEGEGPAPKYLSDPPKWVFKADGAIDSSPSIVGGKVYFGSNDDNWYCVDAETGSLKWKFTSNHIIRSSPAIVDGKVYTGSDDGNVYCLDANTGSLVWKTPTEGGLVIGDIMGDPHEIRSSPAVTGGRVYVGALDKNIYCLDAETGAIIWTYETADSVMESPAVANGRVYVGSTDSVFRCLDAEDGSLLWSWDTIRPGEDPEHALGGYGRIYVAGSACVTEGKVFFFACAGARYWCLDAETGEPIWLFWPRRQRYNYQNPRPLDLKWGTEEGGWQVGYDPIGARTQAHTFGVPAYHDGNLYLLEDYFMQRLNAATGERYWAPYSGMLDPGYTDYAGNGSWPLFRWELSVGFISQSSALYADGKMYIGGLEGSVYCNDAITGKRYSWYETDSDIHSSPSLAYGKIYCGSMDFGMYCFQEGSPREPRMSTTITATLSATEVELDTPITITGALDPVPPVELQQARGSPCVTAWFTRPDGTLWEESWHCNVNEYGWWVGDGSFEIPFSPDMEGEWTVKVTCESTQFEWYWDSETAPMTFTVTAPAPPTPPPPPAAAIPTEYIYAIVAVISIAIIAAAAYLYIKR